MEFCVPGFVPISCLFAGYHWEESESVIFCHLYPSPPFKYIHTWIRPFWVFSRIPGFSNQSLLIWQMFQYWLCNPDLFHQDWVEKNNFHPWLAGNALPTLPGHHCPSLLQGAQWQLTVNPVSPQPVWWIRLSLFRCRTSLFSDFVSLITTLWTWKFSRFSVHLTVHWPSLYVISFCMRMLWKTVLKGLLQSK